MKRKILLVGVLLWMTIINSVNATTWYPSKEKCPVCNHESVYQKIGSYGNYIYNWVTKYQYVYWPLTDFQSVYCCPKCYFSTFMWDFDSIPENKIDTIRTFLKTIKLDIKSMDYLDIPMTTRLEIAENIYRIYGNDNFFWCKFYRVMGYHYALEKNKSKAKESRLKALEIARMMLPDSTYFGQEKEILFIIAAMHNYTGQKDSAIVYLNKASELTYANKNIEDDNAKGFDEYLTDLIKQYKAYIKNNDVVE